MEAVGDAPGGGGGGLRRKEGGWALHVTGPLARRGWRPPRGRGAEEWAEALVEIGRPHDLRSRAELDAIRVAIAREAKTRGGRWPADAPLRALIDAVLARRRAETGGDSLIDAKVVEGALGFWRRRREAPPASIYDLRRRCRMMAVLRAPGGPGAAALRAAGHQVPGDLDLERGGGDDG